MDKFYETKHQIFDLSMEDRLKFCQKMVLEMTGRKLTWSEAKQYYHEMFDCDTYENDTYEKYYLKDDMAFIEAAKEAIHEGKEVVYTCWW